MGLRLDENQPIPCLSMGHIPTKTPSFVQSSSSESSSISRPLHVLKTSDLFKASSPNFILSVRRQSRCNTMDSFQPSIMNLRCRIYNVRIIDHTGRRRFHIRCHATDTRIAKGRPLSATMNPLSDLNLTRLQPRMRPQLRSGHCVYFFDQSCRVRSQINFWPGASQSNAMCSNVSGTLQT